MMPAEGTVDGNKVTLVTRPRTDARGIREMRTDDHGRPDDRHYRHRQGDIEFVRKKRQK